VKKPAFFLPRYKHKRNHDKTGMLLYAGECFVLEVCGANFVEDVQIVGDLF
jgi:hypothetical protein